MRLRRPPFRLEWLASLAALFALAAPDHAEARGQATSSALHPVACQPLNNVVFNGLDKIYQVGNVRVFYTFTGVNAIENRTDANQNGVPDFVENWGRKYAMASRVFDAMGFISPMSSVRFRATKYFDVHIRDLVGTNFDTFEVPHYNSNNPSMAGACAVALSISKSTGSYIDVKASTDPITLMFRDYVQGYFMFRPRWLMDGLADWSIASLHAGALGTGSEVALPTDVNTLYTNGQVFKRFWNRLTYLTSAHEVDNSGAPRFSVLSSMRTVYDSLGQSAMNYVDGTPILIDTQWRGVSTTKAVLQALGSEDKIVSNELQLPFEDWADWPVTPAAPELDPAYNANIIKTIQRTLAPEGCRGTSELKQFLQQNQSGYCQ